MRTVPWLSAMTIAALLAGNAYAQPAPAPAAPAGAADSDIDPDAIEALRRMSAYLGTQTSFELKSSGAFDLVLDDGQRLQFGDNATFKVRRPNGFVIERIGRGLEKSTISFLRTAKIWLLTSFDRSEARNATSGAILSALIVWRRATRSLASGVSAGIEAVMRLQANGAMQFERTPARAMSSAIDCDRPMMPALAAE